MSVDQQDRTADIQREPSGFTLWQLGGVLMGRRESILAATRSSWVFWLGLFFVFVAALAREYDSVDLSRKPWHLFISAGASFLVALIVFTLIRFRFNTPLSYWGNFRVFLGLFWLTAPLALLYAIPYERMFDPMTAILCNLWTLVLVIIWRGWIMTRVISVYTGLGNISSFIVAAAVADLIAVPLLLAMPLPIIQVMGGVRFTGPEKLIQDIGYIARFFSIIFFPILWLAYFWIMWRYQTLSVAIIGTGRENRRFPRGAFAIGVISLAVLSIALFWTQPPQQLRTRTEDLLKNGDIRGGLALMSQHEPTDYPPIWNPPPRIGWPEPEVPMLLDVLDIITLEPGTADWVTRIYVGKFERAYVDNTYYRNYGGQGRKGGESWPEILRRIETTPYMAEMRERQKDKIDGITELHQRLDSTTRPSDRDQ